MEVFPDTPKYSYPIVFVPIWHTLKSQFENGSEQRRQKWLYPKYDVKISFEGLERADAKIIYKFYMARKGSYESFYFFDPDPFDHAGLYVGTGDGITDVFDIPGRFTSAQVLYENGYEVSTGFSYLSGGGDGGADRVGYTVSPADGQIITVDFTGFVRAKVRFKDDNLSREDFTAQLFRYGLELKGV